MENFKWLSVNRSRDRRIRTSKVKKKKGLMIINLIDIKFMVVPTVYIVAMVAEIYLGDRLIAKLTDRQRKDRRTNTA